MIVFIVLFVAFISTVFLTWLVKRFALAYGITDHPNSRSSHFIPTPRGGGLAFVLSYIASTTVLFYFNCIELPIYVAGLGAGLVVATIGWLDDLKHIDARLRLLVHFIGGGWVLYWLGDDISIVVLGLDLGSSFFVITTLLLFLVWLINLFNFMDGINGISTIEALQFGLASALIFSIGGASDSSVVLVSLTFAFVLMGFLGWNFPVAKIFMGDVGSGFLGVMVGVVIVEAANLGSNFFWASVILPGVFVVDSTTTLLRRFVAGEKFYLPHNNHAYQKASRHFKSHKTVTLVVAFINVIWLLPLAVFVSLGALEGVIGIVIAYTPLIFLAVYFRAGEPELQNR